MNDFKCWLGFDDKFSIQKSNPDESGASYFLIKGYASTDSEDLEAERILQEGLDFDYFLNHGYFNFDHEKTKAFGEPTKVVPAMDTVINGITKKATYVEGKLYDLPEVRKMLEIQEAMKKAGSNRRLGMSLEGRIVQRDVKNKKIIRKAKITDIALTWKPVNTDTEAVIEIAKSLQTSTKIENDELILSQDEIKKVKDMIKAMEIGYQRPRKTGAGVLNANKTDKVTYEEVYNYVKKQNPNKTEKDIIKIVKNIMAKCNKTKKEAS